MPATPLYLRTGPFVTRVATSSALVRDGIHRLYDATCLLEATPTFCDFHVTIGSPFLRRWLRPKVEFLFEGAPVFKPSPPGHALPLFEWGLNWVIATQMNQYLIIHAAVVERGGRAMLLPGEPGTGKSTLCAGLAYRGWRLLSDELALIDPATHELVALARPISLKNESIAVMRDFAPDAVQSDPVIGTIKGTIVLTRPPAGSFARVDEPAQPGWIVFPNYQTDAPADLRVRRKAECFIELAANALSYSTLGAQGFETLADVVERSGCFDFVYGDLEEGVRRLTELADAA